MSKTVNLIAGPTFRIPGQGSGQIEDEAKHASVTRACQEDDIDSLIRLATSEGGLLNDNLRRKACE